MAEGGRPAKGPGGQRSLPQYPGVYVPGLASSQKRREVTAISPSQEWVRVPLPLRISHWRMRRRARGTVFVELTPLIPRVSGLWAKYAVVWQWQGSVRLFEEKCEKPQSLFFGVFYPFDCNFKNVIIPFHNWYGISSQVSLSLWLLVQSHDAFPFHRQLVTSPHLAAVSEQRCLAQELKVNTLRVEVKRYPWKELNNNLSSLWWKGLFYRSFFFFLFLDPNSRFLSVSRLCSLSVCLWVPKER